MPILLLLLGVATLAVVASNAGYKKPPPQSYTLDNSMPPDLRNQVLAALVGENDPAKLDAFATALAPLYPLASSQLRAKAGSLRGSPQSFSLPSVAPAPNAPPPFVIPPAPTVAPAAQGSSLLEIGQLPEPTRSQVLQQLASGNDPAALESLASQLDSRSPAASSALRLRASMLRSIPLPMPMPAPVAPAPAPQPANVSPAPQSIPAAPVPAPPAPAAPPSPFPGVGLDPGMPPDLAQAVMTALTQETDPTKLRGFASSIAPQFPMAAALLTAKANTLGFFVTPSAPAPTPLVTPTATPATAGTYTVLPGDFPIKIAQKLVHDGNRWTELVAANPSKKKAVDGNFATLLPGEVLQLPSSWGVPPAFEAVSLPRVVVPSITSPMIAAGAYVVQPGDFPIKIAQKIVHDGKRWPELVAANPAKKRAADGNFANLQPGERLLLPPSWMVAPAPSAQPALLLSPGGSHASST